MLKKEAAENNGYLTIDTKAHFINAEYTVHEKETEPNTTTEATAAVTSASRTQASTASVTAHSTPAFVADRANAPETGERKPVAAAAIMTAALILAGVFRKKCK